MTIKQSFLKSENRMFSFFSNVSKKGICQLVHLNKSWNNKYTLQLINTSKFKSYFSTVLNILYNTSKRVSKQAILHLGQDLASFPGMTTSVKHQDPPPRGQVSYHPSVYTPSFLSMPLSIKQNNHLKRPFWSCNSPAENPPSAFHCSEDTEQNSHLYWDILHPVWSRCYLDWLFFTEPCSDYSSKSLCSESLTLTLFA